MNQRILFLTCLLTNTLLFKSNFAYAANIDIKNIVNQEINKLPVTFKDEEYSQPSNKFNRGNTVFIKVNTSASGSDWNDAWLLDSNKKKIEKITLRRTGNNPYKFFGEVKLPNLLGQYYLSINLKGDNSSFSLQQNIEVVNVETDVRQTFVSTSTEAGKSVRTSIFDLIVTFIQSVKSILKIQP